MHLVGSALQWHLNYMKSRFQVYLNWLQYITELSLRFGHVYYNPLVELISIKQTRTIQEYIDSFELALTQVNLPQGHILSIFLARLEKKTQMQVRKFNPPYMPQVAKLAKLQDSSLLIKPKFPNLLNRYTLNHQLHTHFPCHNPQMATPIQH